MKEIVHKDRKQDKPYISLVALEHSENSEDHEWQEDTIPEDENNVMRKTPSDKTAVRTRTVHRFESVGPPKFFEFKPFSA
jgi:hypothetical protein